MAFSYLDEKNLKEALSDSKEYLRPIFDRFDEFERIARNQPHPAIDPSYPKVTEGTLASFVLSRPKSIIQQIPTGKIECEYTGDKDEDLERIANLILTEQIIPNANTGGTVIQKSWMALTKALTYGSQPAFCFYKQDGDYYGSDFMLPYVKDVLREPGKITDPNFRILRGWYTKRDIEQIIAQEESLGGKAKARKEKYESKWDLKVLQELINTESNKDTKSQTPSERESNPQSKYIEIDSFYQKGKEAEFYGYSPALNKVVWRKVNPDPRGIIPIHDLYAEIDGSNPLGRGAIELSGGMQNLLDSQLQAYQYIQALMMNPPIEKRGNFSSQTIKYRPNAIWDMGNSPENMVKPVNINSDAIQNFSNNFGLMKSTLLNLNQTMDTSISSSVGNPGFSKTSAGVSAQETKVNITDNHLRKQFEGWFGDVMTTCLNIHMAQSSGRKEIPLTQEYIEKQKRIDPSFNGASATVEYDKVRTAFNFKVDASTSQTEDDSEQKQLLKELLELTIQYPILQQKVNIDKLTNRLITKTGVEDPEELIIDPEEQQQNAENMTIDPTMQEEGNVAQEQMQMEQQAPEEMAQNEPMQDMEQPEQGIPMQEQPMPDEDPRSAEEDQIIGTMKELGFTDDEIVSSIEMLNQGYSPEEIFTQIHGGMQQ